MSRTLLATFTASLTLAFASGCLEPLNPQRDFYSEFVQDCGYIAPPEDPWVFEEEEIIKTTLSAACRASLDAMLPFDETFDSAPKGLKDKVIEAFQVILAYPLRFPDEGRILGFAPNAIPITQICIFVPELYPDECLLNRPAGSPIERSSPNRNLFNYLVNKITQITYQPGEDTVSAEFDYLPNRGGHLVIHDNFWDPSFYGNYTSPKFQRAAILVHEARHGDGDGHVLCRSQCRDQGVDGFNCDNEMNEAYGFELVYAESLIRGSKDLKVDGKYVLTDSDFARLAYMVCQIATCKIHNKSHPELRDALEGLNCQDVNLDWLRAREGLARP